MRLEQGSPVVQLTLCLLAALWSGPASAENVDPASDDSQYAYAENMGWINAEPSGDGGPGIQVADFELTGWVWGENIGWVSLSCDNTSSCSTVDYGVTNDNDGVLGGFAWADNVGWISFSCANTASCGSAPYGVTIDLFTGDFSGNAWSENVGWIQFASTGLVPYKVQTSWICTAPTELPNLLVTKAGTDAGLSWTTPPLASKYDVVQGDLNLLQSSGGDFEFATTGCAADNELGSSASNSGNPAAGTGIWFLVRTGNCGNGTYDTGELSQVGLRDAEILASGSDCP